MAASHINGTPKRATPYTTSVDATPFSLSRILLSVIHTFG